MNSRHFRQLATSLARTRPDLLASVERVIQWQSDVDTIANACKQLETTSRFDKGKFLDVTDGRSDK